MSRRITSPANIINHFTLVLDGSGSMKGRAREVVQVSDGQIAHWAQRSKEHGQETRVSVWQFSDTNDIRCLVWDMDVLRLPSIATLYQATNGWTAFIDATMDVIRDLMEIPERHGDHSHLVYVITDGAENNSRRYSSQQLLDRLTSLPEHWTMAALVPDIGAKHEAKKFGFPAGNIEVWDTRPGQDGVAEVGAIIRAATDTYMTNRASGVRSTRSLFSTGADAVNATTVAQANLTPLAHNKYRLVHVPADAVIKDFVEGIGFRFQVGRGFYQLTKSEEIQPQKQIAIMELRGQQRVFTGPEARAVVGLPNVVTRVKPNQNPDYTVFVQSTAPNRKLIAHTKFLYMID